MSLSVLHMRGIFAAILVLLLALVACGDGNGDSSGSTPDSTATGPNPPGDGVQLRVACDLELGLGPADATIVDFMDRERVWVPSWEGETLVLTRSYSCGDECAEEEVLRFENALSVCPETVHVRVTVRDHGSPRESAQIEEADGGTLEIQDWEVAAGGPLLVSGVVDAGSRFVFYLDTRE